MRSRRRPLQVATRGRPLHWLALGLALAATPAGAGEPGLRPETRARHAKALTRALAYDANFVDRAGASAVMAILYKPGDDDSLAEANAWFAQFARLEGVRVQGLPFRAVKLAFASPAAIDQAVAEEGVDALFVCPGLEDELAAIKKSSRRHRIVTMGGREKYVRAGLAIGIFVIDSRSTLMVNLPASREEGAQFGSDLLRLAKVLR